MFGRSRTRFKLRHRATLTPPGAGQTIAAFSIDPAGQPVVLWTGGAHAVISACAPDREAVLLHEPSPECSMVQTLPDGRFVVVSSRAEWRDGAAENNAYVYGADGALERVGCLGDGIEHVQSSADGDIWVGYFDEGIFGNLGWGTGTGGGPTPIGEPGIVRFSPDLDVVWEYPRDEGSTVEPVEDSYALNVIDGDVWSCSYSFFDIVRIREGAVRAWTNEADGASAIAVSGDVVVLYGGYVKNPDRLVIGRLVGDGLEVDVTSRLAMPNGRRLPRDAFVVGRGDELHALVGLEWLTWSLADQS